VANGDKVLAAVSATRFHDFSMGHRVYGHESKCAQLHGHNYRIHFEIEPRVGGILASADGLDSVGRVLDFSVIKSKLCDWLEEQWDHRFLVWVADPWAVQLQEMDPSVVIVPFNPTAENIGLFLLRVIGPLVLDGSGTVLRSVVVEETRKCSARADRVTP
jgi:6-pyruvoyltetrahydropterin/6-carboxytetrahydropterin synthase